MSDFTGKFWLFSILVAVIAYLIGSVSFAVIVSRLGAQDDVRQHGSGNAGMTNILRNYGKKFAAFTAIGDFGKGIVAVLLGRMIFSLAGISAFDGGYIAALFAVLGHLFPLYFGFKGGKGVLTGLGVMLILNPPVVTVIILLTVPIAWFSKIVSLASVIGYVSFPILTGLYDFWKHSPDIWFNLFFALLISALGLIMHRDNIKRLLNGTEYRFGQKKYN